MSAIEPRFPLQRERFKVKRRSTAEVTYDRLVDASLRYGDQLSGRERDAIGEVCQALWEIAEGQRDEQGRRT